MKNKPRKVRIEASSVCQLRCPRCPTGLGELNPNVGSGLLRFADFERFLGNNPGVREIELSNWGEILLNPELSQILQLAHEKGVALTARNGVNLNTAKGSILEDLVKYEMRAMVLSIDGASQETYASYRIKGKFDQVLENVRTINRFKKQYHTRYPMLTWKFIVFGHNQHEVEKARSMAHDLGLVFYPDVNWDPEYSPLASVEEAHQDTGLSVTTAEENKEVHDSDFMKLWCYQLWNEPQINWDGKLLGCCINTWGDFGSDAFAPGGLDSEKLKYGQRMLLGEASERPDVPCTDCSEYKRMKRNGEWIRPWQIKRNKLAKRGKQHVHKLFSLPILGKWPVRVLSKLSSRARRL